MKTRLKAKILTILAILTLGIGWVMLANINNAYAEEGRGSSTSLVVSPMTQKIILVPGETYTGTIDVLNGIKAEMDMMYSVKVGPYNVKNDAGSKDDYGGFNTTETTSSNIMMNWTTLDKTSGQIKPGEKETITYTVKVPKDAPAGAQYIAILVTNETPKESSNGGANTDAQITSKLQLASTVFANVAGETVEKGAIKSNEMPTMLTTNKLEATSMVRSEGNIYTDASYILQVWPLFSDEEICTNEESVESAMVLPNTERYHVQTCDLPAVGIFKAKQVVKIFSEESVLEKTIFVCPIWLMVLVLIIVVAIIVGIIIYIKKRHSAKED